MANHKATGKKSRKGQELAQRSRAAILDAMDLLEKDGKTIGELLALEAKENPNKFMELVSKFIPKDIHAEVSHTINALDLTDDELAAIARGSSGGVIATEAGEEQPSCVH
jgi:hypothetical protein